MKCCHGTEGCEGQGDKHLWSEPDRFEALEQRVNTLERIANLEKLIHPRDPSEVHGEHVAAPFDAAVSEIREAHLRAFLRGETLLNPGEIRAVVGAAIRARDEAIQSLLRKDVTR